jgi:predicted O-methyltransferase YrrM
MIREVLNDRRNYYAYGKIEAVKKNLIADKRILEVEDAGAGSAGKTPGRKIVAEITAVSLSTQKFGRLLFRLAGFYSCGQIIELGTSLGISTSYLASADPKSRVITVEGSPAIAGVAAETFLQLELNNIVQVTGKFEDTLGKIIRENPPADLIYLDGNHRKEPVLAYFEQILGNLAPASLVIIHDIHWSREMEEAWAIIRLHPKVKMTVDIFSAGLVFFRKEFQVKQNFMIRF